MTQQQLIDLGWQLAGWLAVPLAGLAARWLWAQTKKAATDQHASTLRLLAQVATTAVTYAEQTIAKNPDKKTAALQFVDKYLTAHGIHLPVFEIDAAIESAVLTETQHGEPLAPLVGYANPYAPDLAPKP